MAYEDDTVLRGEPRIMLLLAPQTAATFAAFGFEVKVEKSQITGVRGRSTSHTIMAELGYSDITA